MVENGPDDLESLTPELWPLLQVWRNKNLIMGRLPTPDEIVPIIKGRWLRHIALIAPGARAGFVIQICGYDLIRRFGRLADGHRVSTLAPGIRQGIARKLHIVLKERRAVVWRPPILLGRDPIHFSELILPLSQNGQGVSLLLLAALEQRRPRPKPPPEPDFYRPDWEHD